MFGGLRATVDETRVASRPGARAIGILRPPPPGWASTKEKGFTLKIVHTRTYKPEPHGCAPHPHARSRPRNASCHGLPRSMFSRPMGGCLRRARSRRVKRKEVKEVEEGEVEEGEDEEGEIREVEDSLVGAPLSDYIEDRDPLNILLVVQLGASSWASSCARLAACRSDRRRADSRSCPDADEVFSARFQTTQNHTKTDDQRRKATTSKTVSMLSQSPLLSSQSGSNLLSSDMTA